MLFCGSRIRTRCSWFAAAQQSLKSVSFINRTNVLYNLATVLQDAKILSRVDQQADRSSLNSGGWVFFFSSLLTFNFNMNHIRVSDTIRKLGVCLRAESSWNEPASKSKSKNRNKIIHARVRLTGININQDLDMKNHTCITVCQLPTTKGLLYRNDSMSISKKKYQQTTKLSSTSRASSTECCPS